VSAAFETITTVPLPNILGFQRGRAVIEHAVSLHQQSVGDKGDEGL